ncbi:MAG: hypothetical protein ABI553_06815 [Chloroflexota bacterium]
MSKRHTANRRKTYGRRQHEVRERRDRGQQAEGWEFELGDRGSAGETASLGFLDPRSARIRFALGD